MKVGERIDQLVNEYYDLYLRLKERGEYKNPDSMALHDLILKEYIYSEAVRQLKQRIDT